MSSSRWRRALAPAPLPHSWERSYQKPIFAKSAAVTGSRCALLCNGVCLNGSHFQMCSSDCRRLPAPRQGGREQQLVVLCGTRRAPPSPAGPALAAACFPSDASPCPSPQCSLGHPGQLPHLIWEEVSGKGPEHWSAQLHVRKKRAHREQSLVSHGTLGLSAGHHHIDEKYYLFGDSL